MYYLDPVMEKLPKKQKHKVKIDTSVMTLIAVLMHGGFTLVKEKGF